MLSHIKNFKNYTLFLKDFIQFRNQSSNNSRFSKIKWKDRWTCLSENTNETYFDRHYIYHPAWAARILKKINPKYHIDISSTLYFSSIASAFIPIKFYDYRPARLELYNLEIDHADLLCLPFKDESIESISCMHVIEHIGLGRYGDPINPNGDLKAIKELKRILAKDGNLLFVVPIGNPKIMFNAHRVYSYDQIIEYFSELQLIEFSLIPENKIDGGIITNPSKELLEKQTYGCGCFWFKRKK